MKKKDTPELIEKKPTKKEELVTTDDSYINSDEIKSTIKSIEELPGVGEKTAEKLRESGFNDLMSIAVTPASLISEATDLGAATATKIITAARNALKMGFIGGDTLLERRSEIGKIKFQSEELNKLFGGGIETQALTECFGQFGSGKTQIALQLAINVQLPKDKGGLDGYAVIIDTENTFRPERIVQLAESLDLDPKEVLKKIKVARAYSSDHQMLLVERVSDLIEKEKIPIKLLVVDSLMGLFRSEYAGRGTLATRQQKLNRHLHDLQRLSDRYNLAVYITNQVMSRPDVFFGDPTVAIGGNIVGHASTFRVYLRKSKGDKRVARMIDSPCLPESECVFRVNADGIRD
jgi:DNA repair protein RadA